MFVQRRGGSVETTTKEQIIEGTLRAMDEMGEYSTEMREYVKRRLERAYSSGEARGYWQGYKERQELEKEAIA